MVSKQKVELLAPAGSYDSFIAAVHSGADAVYMGLENFNARVMTKNFTIEEYIKAIDYAHKRDVKVYLTLNTLLADNEIKEAIESVYELYKAGLDAVIVQDLGIASLIHKIMPDLALHASTQMSICTLEQVKYIETLGFSRVVLARELSLEEIKYIAKNTKLEIEVFVHGALCVSVSGQCLMSALIGNRSANRGNCAGPCRKKFTLKKNNQIVVANKYILSKKDIYGLDKIPDFIDAGVYSLKIEGRNKTKEYVAGVVKNYREAIDNGYKEEQEKKVLQLFNRSGKSDGYLKGIQYRLSISENSPKNVGLRLGKVLAIKNGYVKIKLEEKINIHDGIEIMDEYNTSTIVTCIRDKNFVINNSEKDIGTVVWLGDVKKASVGAIVYKTSDNNLNEYYTKYIDENIKKLKYDVCVKILANEKISATANNITVYIDYIPENSIKSIVDEAKVCDIFKKTDKSSVHFITTCKIDNALFVPTSKLNELRNKLILEIEQNKIIRKNIPNIEEKIKIALNGIETKKEEVKAQNSLYVYRFNKDIDYIKYFEEKYNEKLDVLYITTKDFVKYEQDILKYASRCKVYFVIENVTLKNNRKYILENLDRLCGLGIQGVLIGNTGYIEFCKALKDKYKIELVGDYSLNVTNKYTADLLKQNGIDKITLLYESNEQDLEGIKQIIYTERVLDYITVMTTRYCVVASFYMNLEEKKNCKMACKEGVYYLIDEHGKRYDVITDTLDCITRLVRNVPKKDDININCTSIRHNLV